jgi:hypothetical protein
LFDAVVPRRSAIRSFPSGVNELERPPSTAARNQSAPAPLAPAARQAAGDRGEARAGVVRAVELDPLEVRLLEPDLQELLLDLDAVALRLGLLARVLEREVVVDLDQREHAAEAALVGREIALDELGGEVGGRGDLAPAVVERARLGLRTIEDDQADHHDQHRQEDL